MHPPRTLHRGGVLEAKDVNIMRLKGTKYPKINELPENAKTCRDYAKANNMCSGAYVQVKFDRWEKGKGEFPGYYIKCWQGINMVIPSAEVLQK